MKTFVPSRFLSAMPLLVSAALAFFALALVPLTAQTSQATAADPWSSLHFLEGTWEAKTAGGPVAAIGTYSFKPDLRNHILARHSSSDTCKGPADFDCEHGDLLYVYMDAPGEPLKAIYLDNEGHVIHYNVTTPTPATAVFLSEGPSSGGPGPGPTFRLTYELKGSVMYGKFQVQLPGQSAWKSYLQWSGERK